MPSSSSATFRGPAAHESTLTGLDGYAPRIAVLIPCYNEAEAIGGVVAISPPRCPRRRSTSTTTTHATTRARSRAAAGAIVRSETFQGKGNVVRRMFADVEAEVYVLVDGDGTYDAARAAAWSRCCSQVARHGERRARPGRCGAFRPGPRARQQLLTGTVAAMFGDRLKDMLSGYRVMSRRFVKSFPALAGGFETETELTVHALELRLPIAEVRTPYATGRPARTSKLRTYRDGFRILRTIVILVKEERPLQFFTGLAALLVVAVVLGRRWSGSSSGPASCRACRRRSSRPA